MTTHVTEHQTVFVLVESTCWIVYYNKHGFYQKLTELVAVFTRIVVFVGLTPAMIGSTRRLGCNLCQDLSQDANVL